MDRGSGGGGGSSNGVSSSGGWKTSPKDSKQQIHIMLNFLRDFAK